MFLILVDVPCTPSQLAEMHAKLAGWLELNGVPAREASELLTAAREVSAVALASEPPCERLEVRAYLSSDAVVVEFSERRPDRWPTLVAGERGPALLEARSLADDLLELITVRSSKEGTTVSLLKRFAGSEHEAGAPAVSAANR